MMERDMIEEYIMKNLWCLTYAAVIASERESSETAVIQANEAVTRYYEAWGLEMLKKPSPSPEEAP